MVPYQHHNVERSQLIPAPSSSATCCIASKRYFVCVNPDIVTMSNPTNNFNGFQKEHRDEPPYSQETPPLGVGGSQRHWDATPPNYSQRPQNGFYGPQVPSEGYYQPQQQVSYPYHIQPLVTNKFAVSSFAISLSFVLTSLLGLSFFSSAAAIILGHIALAQIGRNGAPGKGFAIAGLVIGYATLALLFFGIAILVATHNLAPGGTGYNSGTV